MKNEFHLMATQLEKLQNQCEEEFQNISFEKDVNPANLVFKIFLLKRKMKKLTVENGNVQTRKMVGILYNFVR